MTGTVMMERTSMGVQSGSPVVGAISNAPVGTPTSNWLAVPRCTYKFEKCQGGIKVVCQCDDPTAKSMLQQLCNSLVGGLCSCYCTLNGVTVCSFNFTQGMCKCEVTADGCCFTCTSGDASCCAMLQSCCDCLATMVNSGCTCCFMMQNIPVCCGTCDTSKTQAKR